MDLWTAFVLLTFLVIRILGSGTAQRVLARLRLHFANSQIRRHAQSTFQPSAQEKRSKSIGDK
jgi:hypothetical protein